MSAGASDRDQFRSAPINARRAARAADNMMTRRQNSSSSDGYATHVMTQVDRVHAKGITGAGIRIAVIDSGVRTCRELDCDKAS
jgi:hypothetical protein